MPSTAPLLRTKTFADDLLNAQFQNATLGYGQFAARRGFHIMDAPSQHWVETLSGLGATGVEIILAYGEKFPSQAHPFIPTLQFTCAENSDDAAAQNFDVVLRGDARTCVEQLEESMLKMLAGNKTAHGARGEQRFPNHARRVGCDRLEYQRTAATSARGVCNFLERAACHRFF